MDARLEVAQKQIEFARGYTSELIDSVDRDRWFEIPAGAATHIAWQVGHLAMAEYGLVLFRQRGRQPVDTELMSSKFRKLFSRGSTPNPDASAYPDAGEIRSVFDAVHRQSMEEIVGFAPADLEEEIDMPYAGFPTKFGALLFCSHHEMLHAGQIGVLRRLLGYDPVR